MSERGHLKVVGGPMREVGPYDREADREDEPNPGLIAALRIIGFLVVVVLIGVLAHLAIWAWTF